jgi:hypothetical protein
MVPAGEPGRGTHEIRDGFGMQAPDRRPFGKHRGHPMGFCRETSGRKACMSRPRGASRLPSPVNFPHGITRFTTAAVFVRLVEICMRLD